MKRDGRSLAHNTLEEMRILAVQRMAEGEHPNDVAASFGCIVRGHTGSGRRHEVVVCERCDKPRAQVAYVRSLRRRSSG